MGQFSRLENKILFFTWLIFMIILGVIMFWGHLWSILGFIVFTLVISPFIYYQLLGDSSGQKMMFEDLDRFINANSKAKVRK